MIGHAYQIFGKLLFALSLLSWLGYSFRFNFLYSEQQHSSRRYGVANSKYIASKIGQLIPKADLNEKYVKPPPVYSNKAPLLRRRFKKVEDPRSSDHKKILGQTKRLRPKRNRVIAKEKRLQSLASQIDFRRELVQVTPPLQEDPLIPLIETVSIAADKRKANYIHAMRVFYLTELTSFLLVIEGNSKPQNQAIALSIEEDILLKFGKIPVAKTGQNHGSWIILDYGSVIIHVMTPQLRNYYKLEKKWEKAEILDVNYLFPDRPEPIRNWKSNSLDSTSVIPEELLEEDETLSPFAVDPFWK